MKGLTNLVDGDFTVVDRDAKDGAWLVAYTWDQGPVRYYTWDRTARKGTLIGGT